MTEKNNPQLRLIRMSDVEVQPVRWLWYPYIAFGKITMIQGDPGEGKTTFALRIAAACSNGSGLPGMDPLPPFPILYQTAEDGLGDTVKPRLIEAGADEQNIFCIDESEQCLSLLDERIETAIRSTGARLLILDPIQGYLGDKIDMNRANEIRSVLKKVSLVAERTDCAIVLIGHLNKAQGANSSYRGLGSIDFRAAARSILLVGRMKNDPFVRVVVQDKSSLAPEGKSFAFSLGSENGFEWLDGYDSVTAEELLSGVGNETKTAVAEELIRELLSDGKAVPAQEIFRYASGKGISQRTVNEAKRKIPRVQTRKTGRGWVWSMEKEEGNIAGCS